MQETTRKYFSSFFDFGRGKIAALAIVALFSSILEALSLILLVPFIYIANSVSSGAKLDFTFKINLLDRFQDKTHALIFVLVLFVIVAVTQEYMRRRLMVMNISIKAGFIRNLSDRLYEAFALAKWGAIINRRRSDIANALTNELRIIDIGTQTMLQLVTSVPVVVIQVGICFFISPYGTLSAIAVGALFFWFLRPVNKKLGNFAESLNTLLKDSIADVHEHLNGIKEVKSYGAERVHMERFAEKNKGSMDKYVGFVNIFTRANFIYNSGTWFLIAIFVFISLMLFKENLVRLMLLFIIFLRVWPMFSGAQMSVQFLLVMFPTWKSFLKNLDEFTNEREEYRNAGDVKPLVIREKVKLDNVSFSYGRGDNGAVNNVTLDIPVNSSIAIAGHSGSGKSTLVDLVIGLLEPASGAIFIDGKKLGPSIMASWRKAIGFVPQETFLFRGTIRENLSWARPGASDEELWNALETAAAADFIRALPAGLDTQVGDRGTGFSGGEKQRIALARAVLRKPALLILDEATSSLDAASEGKIKTALQKIKGKMTVITIAHRLSTIRSADEIILLENGSVVERGKYDGLLAANGKFAGFALGAMETGEVGED